MKLVWDEIGKRLYEVGVDQGVLYPADGGAYPKGVVWNGLTAVNESPSGAEPTKLYADNIPYLTLMSAEELGISIEAYTYPDEFAECDGSAELTPGVSAGQQTRKAFGLSYRTKVGNDVEGEDFGYKLHLVYGGKASPTEKPHSTINDSPDVSPFSWEVSTTPVPINTLIGGKKLKPTASLEIDSTKVDPEKLAALEAILYGSETEEARLPLPDEVITLIASPAAG